MKKKTPRKRTTKTAKPTGERTYAELASTGGSNSDWLFGSLSEDADIWQSAWALTSRVRDLFRSNPLYQSYRETLWANVLGANGIMLRMTIKEQEDRVIHTEEEKYLCGYHERRERVMEFLAKEQGREHVRQARIHVLGNNGTRKASVKIGEPDVFANTLIERKWAEWQSEKFCDVRGARNYKTIRQLRLIAAVRDGDFFLLMVKDPRVNKFGFSLRMINSEWCDRFLNQTLENGNVIIMGIEYEHTPWGIGKKVAYHFIKRRPRDWQFSVRGGFGYGGAESHERISAELVIHYARAVDADGTRPAPWVATTIPSSRQRDQAMLAEVIAWRVSACKGGFYSSDIAPEGGMDFIPPDPCGIRREELKPGEWKGLPYGVKAEAVNPTHPNASVKEFRMASIQDGCAGMPGSNYSTMANDYAAINFSAGRLQRLDTNETNMLLQQFDIDYAESKVFDNWLEMSLMTGAIPLPLSKIEKFNSKVFTGRRWRGVDEVKEANAAALRIANKLSSYTSENADIGNDFEAVIIQQAEERMMMISYGINPNTTQEHDSGGSVDAADSADAASTGDIQATALNGAQIASLLEIVGKVTAGEIDADAATALIAASFPLMPDDEIEAIVSALKVSTADTSTAPPNIDKASRIVLQP